MKNFNKLIGIIALVVVIGFGVTACSKKEGGASGGKNSPTAAIEAEGKAVHQALNKTGTNHVLSQETDFKYDLVKIDGQDYVQINGINRPSEFHMSNDTLTIIIPEKIEGFTVGRIKDIGDVSGLATNPSNNERRTIVAVSIPDTVLEIGGLGTLGGGFGFQGTNIESINLPKNLKVLGYSAFTSCLRLTGTITIPEGVEDIGAYAFSGTKITEVIISDNVKTIGESAFADCRELVNVTLPSGPITYVRVEAASREAEARGATPGLFGPSYKIIKRITEYDTRNEAYFFVDVSNNNNAFKGSSKLSLATRSAIEASGYTGSF